MRDISKFILLHQLYDTVFRLDEFPLWKEEIRALRHNNHTMILSELYKIRPHVSKSPTNFLVLPNGVSVTTQKNIQEAFSRQFAFTMAPLQSMTRPNCQIETTPYLLSFNFKILRNT